MRITEIQVKGLFGMFDHVIPLNQEEHLTVIYGINGIGKTMLFKMVDYVSRGELGKLEKIVFDEFTIKFDGNYQIRFEKENQNFFKTYFSKNGIVRRIKFIQNLNPWNIFIKKIEFTTYLKENYNISENFGLKFTNQKKELLSISSIQKIYFDSPFFKEHEEVEVIVDELFDVFFISTQRLMLLISKKIKTPESENQFLYHRRRYANVYSNGEVKENIFSVEQYANELAEFIKSKNQEYQELSEALELSLGQRLIKKEVKTDYTYKELIKLKEQVEVRLSELRSVGLLSKQKEHELEISPDLDPLSQAVLSVNLQDFQTKLKVLDDAYNRLFTFLDILNNRRFSYKKVHVNEISGFYFGSLDNNSIPTNQLSSGEQHELILIYLLLFKVPSNALILLDEPEISLHIVWQKEFLKDMQEIIKLRGFDMLVATHSPSIINGNWDLTVSLKGKEEESYV